jgi:diguanylate cyclase (GGDEF)-like protein/PAS domain S-box-containing protein
MADGKESPKKKVVFASNKRAFGLLFENHPSPMFIYDIESLVFLAVNDAGLGKFGYSRDELKSLTLMDVLSAEDKKRLLDDLKEERRISLLHTDTWRVFLKDGSLREVETTSDTLAYDGHKAVLVLVRDFAAKSDALVVTEIELRALFASMRDAVFVIDAEGVYRKIAPTNPDLLLLPPQELIGKNLRDFFSPDQAESFLAAIHQVLETQQSVRIEYTLTIGDSLKWFGTSISPMDADSTLWVASDITERKQAEAARLESEERFRSLFDHMMDGVYRSTHAGKFVDINPAMIKMFGYSSREEMLAVDIKKELYFAPEERGSHVLDTGQEEVEAYRMRRKDGSEIWVEDHGSYVHDDDGKVQFHEGILRDITARKRVEEMLRISEERFRSLYDNSTVGLYRTTPNGRILMSNPAGIRMLGYDSFEEIAQRNLESDQYQPDYSRREFRERLEREGFIHGLESKWRKKDGSVIFVRESAKVVRDEKGNILYYDGSFEDITAHKRAEEALLKLNKAVDTSTEAIFLTDTQGFFTYVNPGFTALYGFTAEEVIGKTTPRVFKSGLLNAQAYVDFWGKLTTKQEVRGEIPNKRKDGTILYIEGSATPVVDDGGQIIGYLGIQRDVTERKLADEALRSAEANFRSIFENATVGIYQSTPDGRFLRVNQVMAHIFGYNSAQEMVDDVISIEKQYYVDPADRQKFTRLMIEQGQAHEFNSLNYRKDGSHIHIQESARAVKDAQGNIQYYEGFVTDVTARKHAEESLRESEARFRYMADTTPVMVWMAGEDSLCNYFNKRWLDFSGRTMEQEAGNGWVGGIHPDDRDRCVHIYQDAFRVRSEFKMEFRLLSVDGTYRWLLDHGVPRFSMEGEFFGFIGSCVDISDFKQAEDELNRANASLTIAHRELEQSLSHEQVLARTDGLTGLYNYRYFFEIASYEFDASMRYQRLLSIIIFDTDHLKQVNDTLGHLEGDRMLITVAQTAAAHIRNVDSLARYGGDEFVILLPQTNAQMAFAIAERIRENVASLRIKTEKGPLSVTLSIGVAEMRSDPADESIEQVVQRADKALYNAKQAGRNLTVIYSSE